MDVGDWKLEDNDEGNLKQLIYTPRKEFDTDHLYSGR
jgi:hypothetical protein